MLELSIFLGNIDVVRTFLNTLHLSYITSTIVALIHLCNMRVYHFKSVSIHISA